MTKRRDQGPDLFEWGAAQVETIGAVQDAVATQSEGMCVMHAPAAQASEPAPAINFRERREKLPRFILHPMRDLDCMDRWIDRKHGRLAPAPILPFGPRARSPDPGGDGAPLSRVG